MAPIKPFKGFFPVPILPAAQVQATSYAQHLAYIEWYIDYLAEQVALCEVLANKVTTIDNDSTDEQYPSAKAVQTKLNAVAGALQLLKIQVDAIPKIQVNKPLQGGEADLTSLEWEDPDTAVKTLYAVPQGGGNGQQVAVPTQVTVAADKLYISYKDLPAGAAIDRIDVLIRVSGGTVPQVRTLMPSTEMILDTMISTAQDGGNGYCVWNISTSTAGGTTIMTCEISSNTLWTTPLTLSDDGLADNSRIYYHVEA
jgi:hypothetical protein